MKCFKYISLAFIIGISSLSSFGELNYYGQKRILPSIDQEEGRRRIIEFRNFRYSGDICLNFSLINVPCGGRQEVYTGTLWGSWNNQGPVTRVELTPPPHLGQPPLRLLIQNGPNAQIWYLGPDSKIYPLPPEDWFKPLFNNIVYTAFDLSLSFLFWPEFTYEGPQKVKGRVAQLFVMIPPPHLVQANPNLGGMHIAMDMEYNVLLEADMLNCEGASLRSTRLNSFKKVNGEYIIKQFDVVNNLNRDKTRFEVTSASLGASIDPSYFVPENLIMPNPQISHEYFTSVY